MTTFLIKQDAKQMISLFICYFVCILQLYLIAKGFGILDEEITFSTIYIKWKMKHNNHIFESLLFLFKQNFMTGIIIEGIKKNDIFI